MKARIYINRHVVNSNKKRSKEEGLLIDEPAIVVQTYKEKIYCKQVEFKGTLIQDAENAICSGASIWIEAQTEDLIIDGN